MIIDDLRNVATKYEKEAILKQATNYEKQIFNCAFNKALSFGLKWSDEVIEAYGPLQEPTHLDFTLLSQLALRELTGAQARATVRAHCEVWGPLVMLICNKQLRCGVTAVTMNKVFHGLIPQFKVQLAKAIPLSKVTFPCYAETKYDGVRIVITYDEAGEVLFRTRNGKSVNLPKLAEVVKQSGLQRGGMLDTEVTLASNLMEDRAKVSGMINSAMKGGTINEDLLVFNVFDCMSLGDFTYGKCRYTYAKRKVFVLAAQATFNHKQFRAAEAWYCSTSDEVNKLYASHIDQGFEGLILKHEDSMYEFKRSATWAKMKETLSADLECVSIVAGNGKYYGMIGKLVCEGTVDGKPISVGVGSGLTDLDRSMPLRHFLGQTIEVKYNTVIMSSATGKHSLFLPRFVTVRTDK